MTYIYSQNFSFKMVMGESSVILVLLVPIGSSWCFSPSFVKNQSNKPTSTPPHHNHPSHHHIHPVQIPVFKSILQPVQETRNQHLHLESQPTSKNFRVSHSPSKTPTNAFTIHNPRKEQPELLPFQSNHQHYIQRSEDWQIPTRFPVIPVTTKTNHSIVQQSNLEVATTSDSTETSAPTTRLFQTLH